MLNIPNPVLQKIHSDDGFVAPNGEHVPLRNSGGVSWDFCEAIYNTVRKYQPKRALEIGMASGLSTLSILTAMKEIGGDGSLTSIDPFQSTGCRNAGRNHVAIAGFSAQHTVIEEMDFVALPRLLAESRQFDFIYIDGNHDFEHVVLDYFYADQLLVQGGIVGFNDCGWKTVHAAMRHVPPANSYEEIDVGLKPDYHASNPLFSFVRLLQRRSGTDRYFQKRPKV